MLHHYQLLVRCLYERYTSTLFMLTQLFCGYLLGRNIFGREAEKVKIAEPFQLKMSWRNESKKQDCAIFLMRHMETYNGDGFKNWECKLKKKSDIQLAYLRAKYCARILDSELNVRRKWVLYKCAKHYDANHINSRVDVKQFIIQSAGIKK